MKHLIFDINLLRLHVNLLLLDTELGFEHAGLIGERVDSLASGCGRLLLELRVQATQNLELTTTSR